MKKITVYKDNVEFIGILLKDLGYNVVLVEIDGKEYIGRKVNSWVEL